MNGGGRRVASAKNGSVFGDGLRGVGYEGGYLIETKGTHEEMFIIDNFGSVG